MRLNLWADTLHVAPVMKHIGNCSEYERRQMVRYLAKFTRECEREDRKLPILRLGVNR